MTTIRVANMKKTAANDATHASPHQGMQHQVPGVWGVGNKCKKVLRSPPPTASANT